MATKQTAPRSDQIDQFVASARREVGRLVEFLDDDDRAVRERVAGALAEIGPFAVGPLVEALPRAGSPRHRLAIIGVLLTFGPQARAPVTRALTQALQDDPDAYVRAAAQSALSRLIVSDMASPSTATAGTSRASSTAPTRTATRRT